MLCLFSHTYRHWLKVIISLVIVLGITWFGQLIFYTDNAVISFIGFIFLFGQGIIIFILLVLLSKQVLPLIPLL